MAYTLSAYNGATTLTSLNSLELTPTAVLPPGMTFSSAGTLAGTPTQAGTFVFNAKVTDSEGRSDIESFSLTIAPPSADGDYNADGLVDLLDYAAFQACLGTAPAGDCGAAFEYVPNGMIDLEDFALFTGQLTGPAN